MVIYANEEVVAHFLIFLFMTHIHQAFYFLIEFILTLFTPQENVYVFLLLDVFSSKICAYFRKETGVLFSGWVKLALRKETGLSRKGRTFLESIKERVIMKNNNQINIPEAKNGMEQFKMQAAQEVGVNLQNGYNGHLTSREAGSIGGQMVKKMVEAYEQGLV